MKTTQDRNMLAIERLTHWGEAPSPPFSLAVGANCGCDLSKIERDVCHCVNEASAPGFGAFESFDYEDIRHLAGDPVVRDFILKRADMRGSQFDHWNDYALVLRALASMGGVVLCGQGAIDAARGLPNACEVMITNCDHCEDRAIHSWIDADLYQSEALVKTVAGHFLEWLSHPMRASARRRRAIGAPTALAAV